MFPLPQLESEHVGNRLHRELRRAVPRLEREHEATADRPDVHESAPALAEQWQERLRDATCPNRLTSSCAAEVLHRLELERARPHDAGVVHQPRDPATIHCSSRCRPPRNHVRIGDVHEQRRQLPTSSPQAPRRRSLAPNAGEDPEPRLGETERARRADAGGSTRDHDGIAIRERTSVMSVSTLTSRKPCPPPRFSQIVELLFALLKVVFVMACPFLLSQHFISSLLTLRTLTFACSPIPFI